MQCIKELEKAEADFNIINIILTSLQANISNSDNFVEIILFLSQITQNSILLIFF